LILRFICGQAVRPILLDYTTPSKSTITSAQSNFAIKIKSLSEIVMDKLGYLIFAKRKKLIILMDIPEG
jgi:hypothetical protein